MYDIVQQQLDKMPLVSRFVRIIFFLTFVSAIFLVVSFRPFTKKEQMEDYDQLKQAFEPFQKNLSECARQVKASEEDIHTFLESRPQSRMEGKCLVACILRRMEIINKNKVNREKLLDVNRPHYGHNTEVWIKLQKSISECAKLVDDIFEICEYASMFNDCMRVKMEHATQEDTMQQRMDALEQTEKNDFWGDDEDEMLKLVNDEL